VKLRSLNLRGRFFLKKHLHTCSGAGKLSLILAVAVLLCLIAVLVYVGNIRFNSKTTESRPPLLTSAQAAMERGAFSNAVEAYRKHLDSAQDDDIARYGLASALLQLAQPEAAAEQFGQVSDEDLRVTGEAALAYARQGAEAKAALETAHAKDPAPYTTVLLAKIAALAAQHDDVVGLLEKMTQHQFRYSWQWAESRQLLGQALFHLQQLDKARQIFSALRAGTYTPLHGTADAYLRLIAEEENRQDRQDLSTQAKGVAALRLPEAAEVEAWDAWTSRPLTLMLLPVKATGSTYALESGLGDLMPLLLGAWLNQATPIQTLDRRYISDILAEQELSGLLGPGNGALALGKLLGARLMVACKFMRIDNQEEIMVQINSVETSERLPLSVPSLAAHPDSDALVDAIGVALWDAIRESYPIQGRLYRKEGVAEINIGSEVGLRPGMTFDVLLDPEIPVLSDVTAKTTERVSTTYSRVNVQGLDSDDIPEATEDAWYVRIRQVKAEVGS